MTKLRIMSDLHLEFNPFEIPFMPDEKTQILVLAGDICPLIEFQRHQIFFQNCVDRFKEVWYVFGNHEYYGADLLDEIPFRRMMRDIGIKVCHFAPKVIGETLWTNFDDNPMAALACSGMNDFRAITALGGRKLVPSDLVNRFNFGVQNIINAYPEIVITHHSPSYQGLSPKFKGNHLNPAFHSDLDELILQLQPKLWIHGHTHDSLDYMIGATRVICNPRGWHLDENRSFNPCLVIEV